MPGGEKHAPRGEAPAAAASRPSGGIVSKCGEADRYFFG